MVAASRPRRALAAACAAFCCSVLLTRWQTLFVPGRFFNVGFRSRQDFRRRRLACASSITDDRPFLCIDAKSYTDWAASHGAAFPKVELRADETGLTGAVAAAPLEPLEVIAKVPRELALAVPAGPGWEARLTEKALQTRFGDAKSPLHPWVSGWQKGGWGTDLGDLIPRDRANVIGGALLTTGSDNDVEVYRKFGLPCHPVVDRAAKVLEAWTGCSMAASRAALRSRGFAFRACRDDLEGAVDLAQLRLSELPEGTLSKREQRVFQVARYFSLALARAASVDGATPEGETVVVPLHEVLQHCGLQGENTKLLSEADSLKLVAARGIAAGEPLTRDFTSSPRVAEAPVPQETPTGGSVTRPIDEDDTALQILLQSNVRPEQPEN